MISYTTTELKNYNENPDNEEKLMADPWSYLFHL
jgi:hypothetical protein